MTIPNFITIFRFLLVPAVIFALISGEVEWALVCFVVAGVSDGIDGFIARTFDLRSDLGTYLDPIADKALLVSIYVTLAYVEAIPALLAILVVSRDLLIVGAVVLSWMLGEPMETRPHWVSKINTGLQIGLAAIVLGDRGLGIDIAWLILILIYAVGAVTILSGGVYLVDWIRHMTGGEAASAPGLKSKDQRGDGPRDGTDDRA